MIVIQVPLDPGFRKANINSLPNMQSGTIFRFISRVQNKQPRHSKEVDLRVDFIQVRKTAEICELRAVVFPAAAGGSGDAHVRVTLKVDTKANEIVEATCEQCPARESCQHIISLIFFLHRVTTDTDNPVVRDFWGSESAQLADEGRVQNFRIRDMVLSDEIRVGADSEVVDNADGIAFVDTFLNQMKELGQRESLLYRHCRSVLDEFEPLFVHHTLLDTANNCVKDARTFNQHMDDQAKQGMFDRLSEVSRTCYKSQLWLEAQYMRLRCSLIHRIASRKDPQDNEQILEAMFSKDRTFNCEERQQLKQHKRFILKQTEKLENKTYNECGLLLSEGYPYICAAPDGITDDHIVEIKAPKTDDEFEKYLEGRETIAPKYMAQIQIQMYMANVTKALYCVLSPTFDTNGALHYVWVQADMEFVASLLSAAEDFWKDVVFPRLARTYFDCK